MSTKDNSNKKRKHSSSVYRSDRDNGDSIFEDFVFEMDVLWGKTCTKKAAIHLIKETYKRSNSNNDVHYPFSKQNLCISLSDYIDRLIRYFDTSMTVFLSATVYMDRYIIKTGAPVGTASIYMVLLISMTLSTKFHDDIHFRNSVYAKIGGVTLTDFNIMEARMLDILKYDLTLSVAEFNTRCSALFIHYQKFKHVPLKISMTNTYSESKNLGSTERKA